MSRRLRAPVALAVVLSATVAAPGAGQQTIGVGVDYMGFTFADGLGASAAQLFMVPVAVRCPGLGRMGQVGQREQRAAKHGAPGTA